MWEFANPRQSRSGLDAWNHPTSPHSEGVPATPQSPSSSTAVAAQPAAAEGAGARRSGRRSTGGGSSSSNRQALPVVPPGSALAAAQQQLARGVATAPNTPLKGAAPEPLRLPLRVSMGGTGPSAPAGAPPPATSPTGRTTTAPCRLTPGALTAIDQFGQASVTKRLSKLLSATVTFRDVQLVTREEHTLGLGAEMLSGASSSAAGASPGLPPGDLAAGAAAAAAAAAGGGQAAGAQQQVPVQQQLMGGDVEEQFAVLATAMQKTKLVVILVGKRATGKSFLANKMARYLCWLGHPTRLFQVKESLDAPDEEEAFLGTVDEICEWLSKDDSQVAVLDATNRTEERRKYLRSRFHGRWMYILVETVCNDEEVRYQNFATKIRTEDMPEYEGMELDKAVSDLRARVAKVEERYETLTDRTFHFIKLTDMPTGRSNIDINRVSGYLQGRLVFFLMQVCKAGQPSIRKIFLTRHGQSEYNVRELLGGDSNISAKGEMYAVLLPAALLTRLPEGEGARLSVWTSTLKRTIQTAQNLPFPKLQWKALDEINAGVCDGMTYEEIAERMPDEYVARKRDKLRYRYPEGESYLDVIQRLEPVITEVERGRNSICIVSHQAVLRVLYGYMMGVPQEKIPTLEIPLHTLIELTPQADGTMHEQRWRVDISRGLEQFPEPSPAAAATLAKLYRRPRAASPDSGSEGSDTTAVATSAAAETAEQAPARP